MNLYNAWDIVRFTRDHKSFTCHRMQAISAFTAQPQSITTHWQWLAGNYCVYRQKVGQLVDYPVSCGSKHSVYVQQIFAVCWFENVMCNQSSLHLENYNETVSNATISSTFHCQQITSLCFNFFIQVVMQIRGIVVYSKTLTWLQILQ